MTIRNLVSTALPIAQPAIPAAEPQELDVEEPNKKGLPPGEEWVSPNLFASTEKAQDESMPTDGIPKESLEEEALEDFILSFFTLFKEPTDQQVHLLAEAVGMSFDEFERAVYKLTSQMAEQAGPEDSDLEIQDM